jgi:hypothetical protein
MSLYHVEIRDFPRNVNRFNMSGQEIGAILLAWAQQRVFELADQRWNPQTAEITVIEGPEIPVSGLSMGRGWPTAQREGQDVTARVISEAREAIVDGSAARIALEAEAVAAAPAEALAGGLGDEPLMVAAEPPAEPQEPAAPGAADAEPHGPSPPAAAEPLDEGSGEAALAAVEGPGADQLALGVELAALLGPDASRLLAEWRQVAGRASGLSPSEALALAERQLRDRPG